MNRRIVLAAVTAVTLAGTSIAFAQQARPGFGAAGHRPLLEEIDVAAAQQRIRETAQAIDADADGFITTEEVAAHREQRRAERQAERYAALDSDGDGRVSVEEFQAPRLKAIENADLNGDGVITRGERRAARRGGGEGGDDNG